MTAEAGLATAIDTANVAECELQKRQNLAIGHRFACIRRNDGAPVGPRTRETQRGSVYLH